MVIAKPASSSNISVSIGGAVSSSEVASLFAAFDADADGRISASELRDCMRAALAGGEVTAAEAELLVAEADADGDGLLDGGEFARLVARLHHDAGDEDRSRGLRQAFGMYSEEDDEGGCITPASLKRMLARLGAHQDVDECRAMICRFDLDGDGVLSFDEFKIMMNAA